MQDLLELVVRAVAEGPCKCTSDVSEKLKLRECKMECMLIDHSYLESSAFCLPMASLPSLVASPFSSSASTPLPLLVSDWPPVSSLVSLPRGTLVAGRTWKKAFSFGRPVLLRREIPTFSTRSFESARECTSILTPLLLLFPTHVFVVFYQLWYFRHKYSICLLYLSHFSLHSLGGKVVFISIFSLAVTVTFLLGGRRFVRGRRRVSALVLVGLLGLRLGLGSL